MADYIGRDAAKKEFCLYFGGVSHAAIAVRLLDEIPAADVEPVRHGRWISLTDCANAGVYCSVCHKKVYKEDYVWCNRKNKLHSPYCPNCGARMDLEVSE